MFSVQCSASKISEFRRDSLLRTHTQNMTVAVAFIIDVKMVLCLSARQKRGENHLIERMKSKIALHVRHNNSAESIWKFQFLPRPTFISLCGRAGVCVCFLHSINKQTIGIVTIDDGKCSLCDDNHLHFVARFVHISLRASSIYYLF